MIAAPIVYCAEDQVLVDAFEALPASTKAGSYWADQALDDLRSRVKTYYIKAQNTRCCYCNRHLGTDNHRLWDVEHVVSRSNHPNFMFEPKNLATSCPDCNTRKGDRETLTNPKRKTYPSKSQDFRIVHPHFDSYEDHIHMINMVYLPKSEKGKLTIYLCDLLRFAQQYIDWPNSASDRSFEDALEIVFDGDLKETQTAIDAILAKLPIK